VNIEAGTTTYRVALPEFEGPLDLLLHLCKTHEIAIVDIPIAFITTKYLEYLEVMQTMPVDVAADYLVMAATLAYLKSRELVPAPEPLEVTGEGLGEDEGLDPREELIRRLLEYQKYKDAAEKLGGRPIDGRNVFGRGGAVELDPGALGPTAAADESVWKLIEAFGRILEKAGPKTAHDVVVDRISIADRINQLVDRLDDGGSFRFDSCFDLSLPESELRHQVVVTLLAILELARLKLVRVLQADDQETLFVTQVAGSDLETARRVHVTSDNDAHEDANEDANEDAHEESHEDDGEDAADQTDAGSSFEEPDAGDSTLVEPAPAGAKDSDQESGPRLERVEES
jgi:segregation and condensation protein A